jgi:hypothetical protein
MSCVVLPVCQCRESAQVTCYVILVPTVQDKLLGQLRPDKEYAKADILYASVFNEAGDTFGNRSRDLMGICVFGVVGHGGGAHDADSGFSGFLSIPCIRPGLPEQAASMT